MRCSRFCREKFFFFNALQQCCITRPAGWVRIETYDHGAIPEDHISKGLLRIMGSTKGFYQMLDRLMDHYPKEGEQSYSIAVLAKDNQQNVLTFWVISATQCGLFPGTFDNLDDLMATLNTDD